ncbi:MAG: hypothetical protein IJ187_04880 [Neisseriaceae bacterium]|nr:hypothetical protein [Neisseriaceae bacterium]
MENIAEINNNFANRWNISLDNDRFFNSCIEFIGQIIEDSNYKLEDSIVCNKIRIIIGEINKNRELLIKNKNKNYSCFNINDNIKNNVILDLPNSYRDRRVKFCDTKLYQLLIELSNEDKITKFIQAIEIILNLPLNKREKHIIDNFNNILSNRRIRLSYNECNNKYEFYPNNVKELDKALVDDVLIFLKDFPEAYNQLTEALKMFLENASYRDIVDKVRLALELFLKNYLNNDKSLENQESDLGKLLKNNQVSTEIRNMFHKLMDYFIKLNDNKAKHSEYEFKKCEVEFLLYLVGNFIKLIIESGEEINQ